MGKREFKDGKKLTVPGDGYQLRFAQGIIYLITTIVFTVLAIIYGVKIRYTDSLKEYYKSLTDLFAGLGVLFLIYTILQTVAAQLGRKSIKANNVSIAINIILVCGFYGVLGIAGGIKGRMRFQYAAFGCTEEKMREEVRARAAVGIDKE